MSSILPIMSSTDASIRFRVRNLSEADAALVLELTSHAAARLRQRGLREADAQLIVNLGTEHRNGAFIITEKGADALIAELSHTDCVFVNGHKMCATRLKRRIDALRGCAVIAEGRTVITVFHKMTANLRTDPRRDPHCRRRRQRREAERRKRSFHLSATLA